MSTRWSGEQLDRARRRGDPDADAAVAAYFAARDGDAPAALMTALVRELDPDREATVPAVAEFLRASRELPPFFDRSRVHNGQRFFSDWLSHHFTALYLASLPSAYAAARGSHVLWLTTRLRSDPVRRLNETAQFLMDVSAPGSFSADGAAVERILHVRLMHAAVRWLIDHDPAVAHPAAADPTTDPGGPAWSTAWGRPLNQEDLAGTLLTFTTVVYDAFRIGGVEVTDQQLDDHLHLWCVIGRLLGIDEELLPTGLDDARRAQQAIFGRQQEASYVGRALTATLLDLVDDRAPRWLGWMAPAMARRYLGDAVADMVAIPAAGRRSRLLDVLVVLTRWSSRHGGGHLIERRLGRAMMEGLLAAGRGGQRVPFAIPDTLVPSDHPT
ncbi:MAG: oxygenase MpaB family protein [Desertimonas sp.]